MNITSRFTGRWKPKDGDSVTILSAPIRYKKDSQGTVPPAASANWQSSIPSDMSAGDFLWTWTRVNYSDGTHTDSYCVSKWGEDGGGIASSNVKYSVQANQVDPSTISNWGDFPAPSQMIEGYWLYTRTHIEYEGSIQPSNSYSVSKIGQGSHYAGCEEYWALGTDSVTPPNNPPTPGQYASRAAVTFDGTTWSQDRPTQNNNKPYIWNFEISADSSGTCYVTKAICIGNYNKSIRSIAQTYAISAYNTPASGSLFPSDISSGDWKTVAQAATPTEAKPYQWNRNITTYTDGTTDTEYHISAIRGNDGKGTVRIDLDNDNDTMLFDGQGNLIGDPNELYCKSLIRLYVNGTLPNNQPTFTVDEKSSFLAASIYNGNELRVSKGTFFSSSSSSGYVIVGCDWLNVHYSVRFTVKKLINQDKYEVICTPNAVCVNTDDYSSAPSVEVRVWRTKVDGTRENITALPSSDYKLLLNGDTSNPLSYSSGKATFTPSLSHSQEVVSLVFQSKTLDSETVPVSTVENGLSIIGPKGPSPKTVYKESFVTPSTPSAGDSPSGWSSNPPVQNGLQLECIGSFNLESDGWFRSPAIAAGEDVIEVIKVITTVANQVVTITFDCDASSSSKINVSAVDSDSFSDESSASGVVTKTRSISTKGLHTIRFRYHRGSSNADRSIRFRAGNPHIWKSDALAFNASGNVSQWSTPYLVSGGTEVASSKSGSNIIRQSAFEDGKLDQWDKAYGTINPIAKDGHNSFILSPDVAQSYQDNLYQDMDKLSGSQGSGTFLFKRLLPNTWYTMSFWAKAEKYINLDVAASGWSPTKYVSPIYLNAGIPVEFKIKGRVNSASVNSNRFLTVYVWHQGDNGSWKDTHSVDFNTTVSTEKLLSFTPQYSGIYLIGFYMYLTGHTGSAASDDYCDPSCLGYVDSIYLNRGMSLLTYLYPVGNNDQQPTYTVIDAMAGRYKDGQLMLDGNSAIATTPNDNNCLWSLTEEWTYHTLTFKTRDSVPLSSHRLLFRLFGGSNETQICMPKLEEGTCATPYAMSDDDTSGVEGCILRTTQWLPNVTYHNDSALTQGRRFIDIVAYEDNVFQCKVTHTSSQQVTPPASGDNSYWEHLDNTKPIRTPLLLADNAIIKFGQSQRIAIVDNGVLKAGLQAGEWPIWAGGADPATAPFRVNKNGGMFATSADIEGAIKANKFAMPFITTPYQSNYDYTIDSPCNLFLYSGAGMININLTMPDNNPAFNGRRVIVSWGAMRTRNECPHSISGYLRCPHKDVVNEYSTYVTQKWASLIETMSSGIVELLCVDGHWWIMNILGQNIEYTFTS